jgi:uncharacterized protein YdeI (YjbR/CyaY-like superfamily)
VGFYKKGTGRKSITCPESVAEALCFGWIDGVRKNINDDAYTIRFTPRKPTSQWSAVNIRYAETLQAAGRMRPAGLKAFEGAKDQPRKYAYEQRHQATLDAAAERRFRANRKAWDFFQSQPQWYRHTATYWVISAKKEQTRQKRLATLIADSERGKPIKSLDRSRYSKPRKSRPVPKRSKKVQ